MKPTLSHIASAPSEVITLTPRSANEISIVFASDELYAPYLGVAIHSLKTHLSAKRQYTVYILDGGLSANSKLLLECMETSYLKICFVNVQNYIKQYSADLSYVCEHFSVAMYYRFFIPLIFKTFKRVVYCDCDALFLADPGEIYQTPLQHAWLGVIRDTEALRQINRGELYHRKVLSLKQPENYFQSGLLLFNIPELYKYSFTEQCIETLKELKTPRYPDQDVLNVVCEGRVKILADEWNVENHVAAEPGWQDGLPEDVWVGYMQALSKVKFLHYTSGVKPWTKANSFNAELWWSYARQTPFYEIILQRMMHYESKKMPLKVMKMPVICMCRLGCRIVRHLVWGKSRLHWRQKEQELDNHLKSVKNWIFK